MSSYFDMNISPIPVESIAEDPTLVPSVDLTPMPSAPSPSVHPIHPIVLPTVDPLHYTWKPQCSSDSTLQAVPYMPMHLRGDYSMHPYHLVTSSRDAAPLLENSPALAKVTPHNQGLITRAPVAAGDAIFAEVPFVVGSVVNLAPEKHAAQHNSRHAWSIVEQALKEHHINHLRAVLEEGYATGLAGLMWESPGDDEALAYMVKTYDADATLVRQLYDLMATNCVVADRDRMPVVVPNSGGAKAYVYVPVYGFFLLLARINHACKPTATLLPPQGSIRPRATTVVATRALKTGEEVTMDYLQTEPLEGKRVKLLQRFGFRCACAHCRTLCALLQCNNQATKACSACHVARYCCKEHQAADWARHKTTECTRLRSAH